MQRNGINIEDQNMIKNMKATDDLVLLSIATFTLFYIITDFYTQYVPALQILSCVRLSAVGHITIKSGDNMSHEKENKVVGIGHNSGNTVTKETYAKADTHIKDLEQKAAARGVDLDILVKRKAEQEAWDKANPENNS